jgi:bifunctional N-acetylglucosamine-1-phosphate-uridyltransferase/glucosamine-1-phosphate-acetyltransferase GlmU-like protein
VSSSGDLRAAGGTLIVPAAGLGSRLKTATPKLLVPVDGRPMLDRLLHLYRDAVARAIVIVQPAFADMVRSHVSAIAATVDVEVQQAPTGMLDAILLARRLVAQSDAGRVWITWCDQVAIHPQTVHRLRTLSDEHAAVSLIFPTVRRACPYTHLERDASGRIVGVRHRREGDAMPDIGESEVGLFSLSREAYLERLPAFAGQAEIGGATGERNFLPFIPWIAARGEVMTYPCVDEEESIGVNTLDELRVVESYLARRDGTRDGL